MWGWLIGLLILLLALGAGGLVLVLYVLGIFRHRTELKLKNVPTPDEPRFPAVLVGLTGSMPSQGRPTGFYTEADAIFKARMDAVRAAEREILFETFFMTPGRRADAFAEALIARARAGVSICVLVDANGTNRMPDDYWEPLRAVGVDVRKYHRFSWRAPLDYLSRTHRKLLLVDGRVALIGGAGISDWWDGREEQDETSPWRDFEIRFEGHVVGVLAGIFMSNWSSEGGAVDLDPLTFQEAREDGRPLLYVTTGEYQLDASSLRMLIETCALAATRRLWLASPYYLPSRHTTEALCLAARRGVDVRVLTMGPKNDRPYVYHAAREGYGTLLEQGVRIYEYQPAMMHAKAMLLDDAWMSTGSGNLDPLSFFHNNELNISHADPEMMRELERFFEESFEGSHCVGLQEWRDRPLLQKVDGKLWRKLRRIM